MNVILNEKTFEFLPGGFFYFRRNCTDYCSSLRQIMRGKIFTWSYCNSFMEPIAVQYKLLSFFTFITFRSNI